MIKGVNRAALLAALSILFVVWTGCSSSSVSPDPGAGGTSSTSSAGTSTASTSTAGTGGAGTSTAGTGGAGTSTTGTGTSAAGTGGAGSTSTAGTGGTGTGGAGTSTTGTGTSAAGTGGAGSTSTAGAGGGMNTSSSSSSTGAGGGPVSGAAANATWEMFSGSTIVLSPTTIGAISATAATLTGLKNKNVANNAARFDVISGMWPAEVARAADRYVEFAIPVANGTFTLTSVSVDAGPGGGSNIRWDIVYSLAPDFSSSTDLGTNLSGTKDALTTNAYPGLGVSVSAGQTLLLRVYPYSTTAATGKSIMLANVVVSGTTN